MQVSTTSLKVALPMQSSDAARMGPGGAFCLQAEGFLETGPACLARKSLLKVLVFMISPDVKHRLNSKMCGYSGSGC